ncbi:MarR family winged helix-turn-helix transcriptional regulator [Actinacidiphila alni]|uniref:MarR family winged helix-turn-helix transcriptional regulator n=1 Tax=Actinacidiphila alni TaxID=380248 RepID=UPI0034571D87
MPHPARPPIGLHLAGSARGISRAFDEALAEAGGSTPSWLILISLKTRRLGNQRELAAAVGIRGATLTHHLNAMEDDGLVRRRRDPANRRVQQVELTEKGETAFLAMRDAAVAFDRRLRDGLTEAELAAFESVLDRLHDNVVPAEGDARGEG